MGEVETRALLALHLQPVKELALGVEALAPGVLQTQHAQHLHVARHGREVHALGRAGHVRVVGELTGAVEVVVQQVLAHLQEVALRLLDVLLRVVVCPRQPELHHALVVVAQVQRGVGEHALRHGLQVLRPAHVLVVAHHAVPLARGIVVDLAVRAPQRDLVLRVEQEVGRVAAHLLRLSARVAQPRAQ